MMDRDRQLIRVGQRGNKAALGKLAHRYRDQVLALAFDFLNDYEKARDVAQEVFIKAFKNIRDFEEKSRFSVWLFRLTFKNGIEIRKRSRQKGKFLRAKKSIQNANQSSGENMIQTGFDDRLFRKIENLTDHQQIAIILRYYHENSIREIADVLECTESMVRSYLHRAFQKLEKSLKKRK